MRLSCVCAYSSLSLSLRRQHALDHVRVLVHDASRYNAQDKIAQLRRLQFEHQTSASPQALASPSGSDDGSGARNSDAFDADSSPSERAPLGSPRPTTDASQKTPVIVPEVVWENQRLLALGPSAVWSPVAFEQTGKIAAFYSTNRGILGHALSEVVPARLLNKPHLWVTPDWAIDHALAGCDADGWIYATDFSAFDQETGALTAAALEEVEQRGDSSATPPPELVVRRRRVIRKRRIDGSDLSWFQELLDCRYVSVWVILLFFVWVLR